MPLRRCAIQAVKLFCAIQTYPGISDFLHVRADGGQCRQSGNEGYFNGFPDKAGVEHVLDGNLDNEDAALRLNDH